MQRDPHAIDALVAGCACRYSDDRDFLSELCDSVFLNDAQASILHGLSDVAFFTNSRFES